MDRKREWGKRLGLMTLMLVKRAKAKITGLVNRKERNTLIREAMID